MRKKCLICHEDFEVAAHKHAHRTRTCRAKLSKPGSNCWFEIGGLHTLIAESLRSKKSNLGLRAEKLDTLLRELRAAATKGESAAKAYLQKISPPERWMLQEHASASLRDWLLTVFKDDDLRVFPELAPAKYTGVPETLLPPLHVYSSQGGPRFQMMRDLASN